MHPSFGNKSHTTKSLTTKDGKTLTGIELEQFLAARYSDKLYDPKITEELDDIVNQAVDSISSLDIDEVSAPAIEHADYLLNHHNSSLPSSGLGLDWIPCKFLVGKRKPLTSRQRDLAINKDYLENREEVIKETTDIPEWNSKSPLFKNQEVAKEALDHITKLLKEGWPVERQELNFVSLTKDNSDHIDNEGKDRPIAILPPDLRILEKVIYDQLNQCKECNVLTPKLVGGIY